jgi:triacylglycerol lipase
MLAFLLRCLLAAEVAAAIAIAVLLVKFAAFGEIAAAAAALALVIAIDSWPIIASFPVSRRYSIKMRPEMRVEFPALMRTLLTEWLVYLLLFVVIQPFHQLWVGHKPLQRRAGHKVPVLLVHGYFCNRGAWWWMRRKLAAAGFCVATIDLEPPWGDIDALVDQLHARIEALRTETGTDQVALIAHSMGGLAARGYLRKFGSARIASLMTLAAPHHGTWLARYGYGEGARQMEPDSPWIRDLPEADPRVPIATIWSPTDNLVAPQNSARLLGARDIMLPAVGHLSMLFSAAAAKAVTGELMALRLPNQK